MRCPQAETARRARCASAFGRGGRLEVTGLIAQEFDAPAGAKPIEWRLLTNREAVSLEAAVELIDWYRARWEIEPLFLVLKKGCRVEALQLATIKRLERALAVYLVVAWRVVRLMRLGRTLPDLDAALHVCARGVASGLHPGRATSTEKTAPPR